jgi:hypothetical protein
MRPSVPQSPLQQTWPCWGSIPSVFAVAVSLAPLSYREDKRISLTAAQRHSEDKRRINLHSVFFSLCRCVAVLRFPH